MHISEVADTYVRDINDFLKEHDSVRVKVINITDGKIGLRSNKQTHSPRTVVCTKARQGGEPHPPQATSKNAWHAISKKVRKGSKH